MYSFPFLLTLYAGFIHAFEADHLLAVGSIVSQRNNTWKSILDGIYWGLGHASTICLIGLLMILFKVGIPERYFHYFEALVGLMLIMLAAYRLTRFFRKNPVSIHSHVHGHSGTEHRHFHIHLGKEEDHGHKHSLAYGIGLVHGLAGSGALILVAMAQMKNALDGLSYLVVFGGGCIAGMLVAAGLFSLPFSKKIIEARTLQQILIVLTAILCFIYGGKVIYGNLIA